MHQDDLPGVSELWKVVTVRWCVEESDLLNIISELEGRIRWVVQSPHGCADPGPLSHWDHHVPDNYCAFKGLGLFYC